jgi:LysR family glycine cleavage system transcriptional activator
VDAGVDADRGSRFEHTYFLLEAAASGLGAAIGSYPLVEQDLKSGRLTAPFGFVPSGSAYHLLSPRMGPSRARATTFAKWLMAEAA